MGFPLTSAILGLALMATAGANHYLSPPVPPSGDDCAGKATGGTPEGGGWTLGGEGNCTGGPCSKQTNEDICWWGCDSEGGESGTGPGGCCTLTLGLQGGTCSGDIGVTGNCLRCGGGLPGVCDVAYDTEGDATAACAPGGGPIGDPD